MQKNVSQNVGTQLSKKRDINSGDVAAVRDVDAVRDTNTTGDVGNVGEAGAGTARGINRCLTFRYRIG